MLLNDESLEDDNNIIYAMSSSKSKSQSQNQDTNAIIYIITGILIAFIALSFGFLTKYLPLSSTCHSSRPYNFSEIYTITRNDNQDYIYNLAVITDLDHDSKHQTKKNTWFSYFKKGKLTISKNHDKADVLWYDNEDIMITSQISAGGRSMELSDLKIFDGHLLTVDDRTGIIYQLENGFKDAVPWLLLNDGPGNITKGLKGEWMTVKNNQLVVGGLGKEWTTTEGVFVNHHPMYVKFVTHTGEVQHVDWRDNYLKLRKAVGIEWPGYMIHESGQWSEVHQKWFFMPRRASTEIYTEATDEFAGTNYLLIADEHFNHVEVKHIGDRGNGARGFSGFQFVPGTNDNLIAALKSEEKHGVPVASYLTIFRLSDGHILLNEKPLKGAFKFEGIAFL